MTWQYSDFLRIVCVAASRHEALGAIELRIEKLRSRGWEIPQDSYVEIRPSGFGHAASLCLPERCRRGQSYVLRRWIEPHRRMKSDTFRLYDAVVMPDDDKKAL